MNHLSFFDRRTVAKCSDFFNTGGRQLELRKSCLNDEGFTSAGTKNWSQISNVALIRDLTHVKFSQQKSQKPNLYGISITKGIMQLPNKDCNINLGYHRCHCSHYYHYNYWPSSKWIHSSMTQSHFNQVNKDQPSPYIN